MSKFAKGRLLARLRAPNIPWLTGQWGPFERGRIAALNRVAIGAYSTDVRRATSFRGAEKTRIWLGDRYSMARWRNGSDQGFYYGT